MFESPRPQETIAQQPTELQYPPEWHIERIDQYFRKQQHGLGLTDALMKDKKILDVGAGGREFAAGVLLNHITEEIYSLEPGLSEHFQQTFTPDRTAEEVRDIVNKRKQRIGHLPPEIQEKINQKTVVALGEQAPFRNNFFDIVVATCVNYADGNIQQLAERLCELLAVGKEVRIAPVGSENPYPQFAEHPMNKKFFDQALILAREKMPFDFEYQTTSEEYHPDYLQPRGPENPRLLLKNEVLILRKRLAD